MATGTATFVPPAVRDSTSSWPADMACSLAALWLVGGLYLDGWAHTHRSELETFFTPWHAVLYSGFTALAVCIALPVLRRRRAGMAPRESIPAGYGAGLAGVAIFLVGGVADMAWHTFIGIEVDLEALLSPPHLMLLTGATLMMATPVRAVIARTGGLPTSPRAALPAIVALFAATAVAAFFLSYTSPFSDYPYMGTPRWDWQATGLANHLVTTVVLVMPVIAAYTRGGRPPAGLITAVTAAVVVPVGVFHDFSWPPVQIGAVAGGVAADVVVQAVAARAGRFTPVVAGAAIPALVWAGYVVGVALSLGVAWSLELWSGTVLMATLVGAAIGWLVGARR